LPLQAQYQSQGLRREYAAAIMALEKEKLC
jgi:hypothetical protein